MRERRGSSCRSGPNRDRGDRPSGGRLGFLRGGACQRTPYPATGSITHPPIGLRTGRHAGAITDAAAQLLTVQLLGHEVGRRMLGAPAPAAAPAPAGVHPVRTIPAVLAVHTVPGRPGMPHSVHPAPLAPICRLHMPSVT